MAIFVRNADSSGYIVVWAIHILDTYWFMSKRAVTLVRIIELINHFQVIFEFDSICIAVAR